MNRNSIAGGIAAATLLLSAPLAAQEEAAAPAPDETVALVPAASVTPPCELHVWPTENYLGVKMGLLSGFGVVGVLADQAANKKGVTTVKDLMREYLGPEIQLGELAKLDYVTKLGLAPADYAVTVHEPTPWNEDLKDNPTLKAQVKELNRKLKNGERLTESANPCYAELITTHIFYHKAMMYGSNLFTGWAFRKFEGDKIIVQGDGQVKNPLEEFPPKDETMVEAAKAELRDAYAHDFVEWVEKKSGA